MYQCNPLSFEKRLNRGALKQDPCASRMRATTSRRGFGVAPAIMGIRDTDEPPETVIPARFVIIEREI